MVGIIVVYSILALMLFLVIAFCSEFTYGLQWVNPIVIYDNVPVNWFGCIVLTILAHIAAGPWVVFYWFYKLCTVGRK